MKIEDKLEGSGKTKQISHVVWKLERQNKGAEAGIWSDLHFLTTKVTAARNTVWIRPHGVEGLSMVHSPHPITLAKDTFMMQTAL